MRRHVLLVLCQILMASVPSISLSNTLAPVVAYVTEVGTYDDGSVFVFFDRTISSCSSTNRLDLGINHPARKEVFSIAMSAFLSGNRVKVHPGGCNGIYATFDAVGDSYLYFTGDPAT